MRFVSYLQGFLNPICPYPEPLYRVTKHPVRAGHNPPPVVPSLTSRHRASCILGQAFHYSPENAFYIECNRRNGPDFGRVFLRSNYTDITQNTYIQSSMVTEILAREV